MVVMGMEGDERMDWGRGGGGRKAGKLTGKTRKNLN